MSLVVFGSLKGAPGVTTLLACMAYQWPRHRRVALVEADCDGGTLAARFGLHPDTPSLVSFAALSRHGVGEAEFWSACQRLPGGPPVMVAAGGEVVAAAVEQIDFAELDRSLHDVDLLTDAGRLRAGGPMRRHCAQADVVVVVVQPRFEGLATLLDRAEGLCEQAPLLAVVAGDGPYPPTEIDAALRQTTNERAWVLGTVAWDPRGAVALGSDSGREKMLRRSLLARSVRQFTDVVAHLAAAGVATAPRPDAP